MIPSLYLSTDTILFYQGTEKESSVSRGAAEENERVMLETYRTWQQERVRNKKRARDRTIDRSVPPSRDKVILADQPRPN